jgi:hypothetical protein
VRVSLGESSRYRSSDNGRDSKFDFDGWSVFSLASVAEGLREAGPGGEAAARDENVQVSSLKSLQMKVEVK